MRTALTGAARFVPDMKGARMRFSKMVQLLGRPQLIEAKAAAAYARRLIDIDPRAMRRPTAFAALARAIGIGRGRAMDDYEAGGDYVAPTRPVAYAPLWMGEPDVQLEWGWSVKDGIAMMEIAGPLVEKGGYVGECGEWMHGYDTIAAAIAQADANGAVKGMLIRFDTPGGVVASGIYDLATSLQKRDASAKPIWAHAEMACSAGYWIASQCDRVLAPGAGLVGSIGVVIVHENYAGALKEMGIEITSIEFPQDGMKTDGAWWKAMSPEGKAALQSDIDELGAAFLSTVHIGRGDLLPPAKAKGFGAQVFPAVHSDKSRDALALGLIDGVMSEQQAFEALKAETAARPITIPAPAGSTAAPAASKPATTGALTETDMKRQARINAVLAGETSAKTDSEKLEEIRKITNAEDDEEDADAEGEEGEEGEGEEDDEGEEVPAAAAPSPKPAAVAGLKKPNGKTVLAIMDLPEAEGREKQARKLAETPGMTVEMAKGILAAGAKGSSIAANATDINVTARGGQKLTDEEKRDEQAFAAAGIVPLPRRSRA